MLGLYEESVEWLDEALAIDPKHLNSLFGKGMDSFWHNFVGDAIQRMGRFKESIEWYEKVLAINLNDVYSLFGKGMSLLDLIE